MNDKFKKIPLKLNNSCHYIFFLRNKFSTLIYSSSFSRCDPGLSYKHVTRSIPPDGSSRKQRIYV